MSRPSSLQISTRCAAAQLTIIVGSLLLSSPSRAQDTAHVWTHTISLADSLRASDFSSIRRRQLSTDLRLSAPLLNNANSALSLDSSLSFSTDFGPEQAELERLDHPDDANLFLRQLFLNLNINRAFNLKVGRMLILQPAATLDLDGVKTEFAWAHNWSFSLYAGLPVSRPQFSFNPSLYDSGKVDSNSDAAKDLALATGATLSVSTPHSRLSVGLHRTSLLERRPPETPTSVFAAPPNIFYADTAPFGLGVRNERLGAAFYGQPLPWLSLTSDARFDLVLWHFERIFFDLTTSPLDGLYLGLAVDADRPSFDLDAIWSVFGANPQGGYRLHASQKFDTLSLATASTWRAFTEQDTLILPGLMTVHDDLYGLEFSASWFHERPSKRWFPLLQLQGRFRAETGELDAVLSGEARCKLSIEHHNWIELHTVYFTTRQALQPLKSGESAAAAAGFGWRLQRWGEAVLRGEVRSTPSYTFATRLMAWLSLDFDIVDTRRTP